jgi:TetR/AcrR family transcriptional regulator, transcriptional repressor for nem operon
MLDVAERLVQTRGFNAFSYADVAKALGIRKASLHHHYATKSELGLALLERYRRAFGQALRRIEAGSGDTLAQLRGYVTLYGSVLRRGRMCMCGMLAADVATLPRPMRESVASFFAENEAWLARVLEQGRRKGAIRFEGRAGAMADVFVSSLEGAMLMARGGGKARAFEAVAGHLLAGVGGRRRRSRPVSRPAPRARARRRAGAPSAPRAAAGRR